MNEPKDGGRDPYAALHLLVEAHAAPHLRALAIAELSEAAKDDEEIRKSMDAFRQTMELHGLPADEIESALGDGEKLLRGIGASGSPELERVCQMAVEEGVPAVVLGWSNALHAAASESNGIRWLRLSLLDDCMLPKNDDDADLVFSLHFPPYEVVNEELARDILRRIRASLPPGKVLPDEMVTVLDKVFGVTVVP